MNLHGRGEKTVEALPSKRGAFQTGQSSYVNLQVLGQHGQDPHKLQPERIAAYEEGGRHTIPPLVEKLLAFDSCGERESGFF